MEENTEEWNGMATALTLGHLFEGIPLDDSVNRECCHCKPPSDGTCKSPSQHLFGKILSIDVQVSLNPSYLCFCVANFESKRYSFSNGELLRAPDKVSIGNWNTFMLTRLPTSISLTGR